MLLNKNAKHLVHFQYFRRESVPITSLISSLYWCFVLSEIFFSYSNTTKVNYIFLHMCLNTASVMQYFLWYLLDRYKYFCIQHPPKFTRDLVL